MSLAKPVGGVGGGVSTWEALTDTDTFSGNGGLTPYLNAGEDTLLFGGWNYDGSDLFFTSGNVAIGHVPTQFNALSIRHTTTTAELTIDSDGEKWEPVNVFFHYDAVNPAGTFAVGGSAIRGRVWYGGGATPPRGTVHAGSFQMKIKSAGSASNEYAGVFNAINHEGGIGGRIWGQDNTVTGPNTSQGTQMNLMDGAVYCINNYRPETITNGSHGIVIVTRPHAGAGTAETHIGDTSYPIDAALAIVGWSGKDNRTADTVGFSTGIQIGGFASGWMQSGASKLGKGITITDVDEACLDADGVIKIADNSPSTPEDGMLRYDATDGFEGRHNGSWDTLGGAADFVVDGGAYTDPIGDIDRIVDGGSYV
jgi:hypothetical protein